MSVCRKTQVVPRSSWCPLALARTVLSGSKSDRSMMETGFGDNVMEAVFVHSLSAKRCQQVTMLLCVFDTFVICRHESQGLILWR